VGIIDVARSLMAMGFTVYATEGTGSFLQRYGLKPTVLPKIAAGVRPNVLDLMSNGQHLACHQHTDAHGLADG
jgi:carbamoyl-phosphate synthase large subunit